LVRTLVLRGMPLTYRFAGVVEGNSVVGVAVGEPIQQGVGQRAPEDDPVVGIGPFTTPMPTSLPFEARTYMLPAESNAMSPLLPAELFPVGRLKVAITPVIRVLVLVLKP